MRAAPSPYVDRNEGVLHAGKPHTYQEIPPSIAQGHQPGRVHGNNICTRSETRVVHRDVTALEQELVRIPGRLNRAQDRGPVIAGDQQAGGGRVYPNKGT